jgi:hypothetical protein
VKAPGFYNNRLEQASAALSADPHLSKANWNRQQVGSSRCDDQRRAIAAQGQPRTPLDMLKRFRPCAVRGRRMAIANE